MSSAVKEARPEKILSMRRSLLAFIIVDNLTIKGEALRSEGLPAVNGYALRNALSRAYYTAMALSGTPHSAPGP